MRLTIAELMRTLEYVPKETAPDLYEKILGHLVATKFHEALSGKKGTDRDEAYQEVLDGLNEVERTAWHKTGSLIH